MWQPVFSVFLFMSLFLSWHRAAAERAHLIAVGAIGMCPELGLMESVWLC